MNNFTYSSLQLSEMIIPNNSFYTKDVPVTIKSVGITGASGFLGLHLISKLLADKSISKIKCFIRSKDTFDFRKKLFSLEFDENRLEFLYDFNKTNTKDLDVFIHSAAQVHNLKSLSRLYKDNVELTKKVVDEVFCPIIYIGTLSTFASSNIQGNHLPIKNVPSSDHFLYGGYAQSKWLGEYLVSKREDAKILRLGLLTPSTITPALQKDEFFSIFLKLVKAFPYYPESYENSFIDISPIDLAVEGIVHLLHSEEKYIHIANKCPTSISEFINVLGLTPIKKVDWLNYLESLKTTEKILLSYAYFKTESLIKYPSYFNIDLFQTTGHNWNGNITIDNLPEYLNSLYEKI